MLKHITLRPYCRNDREAFLSLFRDDVKEMYYQPSLEVRGMTRRFLEETRENRFLHQNHNFLVLMEQEIIGCASIARSGPRGELGCYIRPDRRGKGYGIELLEELLNKSFQELQLHEVYSLCLKSSKTEVHLFSKLGFQPEEKGALLQFSFHRQTLTIPLWARVHVC